MNKTNGCKNFNHSRILVSILYCPDCGERFNVATEGSYCTDTIHGEKTKKRYSFCSDCGRYLGVKRN